MNKFLTFTAGFGFTLTVSAALAAPQAIRQDVKTGVIMGYVRDSAGKPLAQAVVEIVETHEFVRTDNSGKYLFVGENAGTYTLTTQTPPHVDGVQRTTYAFIKASVVVKPNTAAVLNFALPSQLLIFRSSAGLHPWVSHLQPGSTARSR